MDDAKRAELASRFPTKGRPAGTKNKLGVAAKDAIAQAAAKLGGVNRLVEWAQEDPLNERVFWGTIFPKLLPLEVRANVHHEGSLVEALKMLRAPQPDPKPHVDAEDARVISEAAQTVQ